ncbi:hypothetical protein [Nocardioides jensenii]|uniref:hypothetical protein n=1 Tax=Nocardioides jensenii TaxID=1843 RepID=UPI001FDEE839|nr:hypothetical protein [Nocardioides jensenii]
MLQTQDLPRARCWPHGMQLLKGVDHRILWRLDRAQQLVGYRQTSVDIFDGFQAMVNRGRDVLGEDV